MINIAIIWGLIFLFILQPGIAHEGAEIGARLFISALLPYLLPYIILTQWLLKTSAANTDKATWKRYVKAYILGSFGGFPVGAVTVSEMTKRNEISTKQGGLLLAACHAPGPMFIIGFVGTELFGDIRKGWMLLIAIHVVNILFFLLISLFLNSKTKLPKANLPPPTKRSGIPLLDAIKDSSNVIILVATTVIFFSSLGAVLANLVATTLDFDTGITQTILLSVFEMTAGVQEATVHLSHFTLFPLLIAAIISVNGLSIHMQVAVIAKSTNLSLRPYILGRLWSILLVPIVFYFLL
ncbi:hypothetical protein [Sporosarcina ureilytica]|uniref:Sporulation integral membrane protein YlbJ n=1 Tax=Sporosarcina ureilytica TaxID=298596 RepID=A0A1D8JI58_9BACL|nr:hypothetical protein [Sporosarcina ureilytica]AOV08364.1 hypothetical protein BI350_13015 [Sporosarcina ureilytica]